MIGRWLGVKQKVAELKKSLRLHLVIGLVMTVMALLVIPLWLISLAERKRRSGSRVHYGPILIR